ncbi:MAG: hypothetical protein R3208_17210 [Ketobacteraceae bacterium]|nr:hypothetical protein [Ketobacteraceae bacterium]
MTRKHIVSSQQAEELLHRAYDKASSEEPSEALDDAILARARAEIDSSSEPDSKSASGRPLHFWQRFGSVAATFVLVATIGMIYYDNRHQMAPENPVRLMSEPETELSDTDAYKAEDGLTSSSPQKAAPGESFTRQSAGGLAESPPEATGTVADDAMKMPVMETRELENSLTDEVRMPAEKSAEEVAESVSGDVAEPMPAPARKKEQRSLVPAMKSMQLAPPVDYEQQLQEVRNALAQGDMKTATERWNALRNAFPDADFPADLVQLFGDDNQVGEADKIDGDAGSDNSQ